MYNDELNLEDAPEEQIKLKIEIDNFNQYAKPKSLSKKEKIVMTYENANRLLKGSQKVLNGFESKVFPIKLTIGPPITK